MALAFARSHCAKHGVCSSQVTEGSGTMLAKCSGEHGD